MAVSIVQRPMLYCPKCSRTYEEGTQRFCTSDGSRLIAAPPSGKPAAQPKAVFSNLLKRALPPDEKNQRNMFDSLSVGAPKEAPAPPANLPASESSQTVQAKSKTEIKPPVETKPKIETKPKVETTPKVDAKPAEETKPEAEIPKIDSPTETKAQPVEKPVPRLIKPHEILPSQATLGDRSVNPTGRVALTWENPGILLGQTVKGRYYIIEKLSEDETSIAYLAEDKIIEGKKAVVRVLMDEKDADDFSSKILAEERVSLSHINHPNVANVLDSGELLEGKSFIVTEYTAGESLKEKFRSGSQFNSLRTARIIRQVASALSEVHENGILHRNLKPQNIILGVSESGSELVKVTDFAVFDGFDEQNPENIKYLSPEQLEGRMPNYASDIYSLAVITYQMLTGRVPFNFSSEKELLKAQKEGLSLRPTNLRLDLPPVVDAILEKALAYKSQERYQKARELGDALFNALNVGKSLEKNSGKAQPKTEKLPAAAKSSPVAAPGAEKPLAAASSTTPKKTLPAENKEITETGNAKKAKLVKAPPDLAWQKRSPEPPQANSTARLAVYAVVLLLLGTGAWAIWNNFSKRQDAPAYVPQSNTEIANVAPADQNITANINIGQKVKPTPKEVESPPLTRQINQPPDTEYFENSKENLKGELARNFRGFSFYYPKDWTKNSSQDHFVDVARRGATGTPIEQMLVSYYGSKGTFAADMENFPKLVQKSNQDLKEALGSGYRLISQGETKINGEWRAYEMKFKQEGVTKNGDKITLWGRRLWIPAARQGVRSGFVITMLATSLSPEVKSADDLGVKGELATVLQTFEPASLDSAY
jgi:serine/threonine protein kinase